MDNIETKLAVIDALLEDKSKNTGRLVEGAKPLIEDIIYSAMSECSDLDDQDEYKATAEELIEETLEYFRRGVNRTWKRLNTEYNK